MAHDRGCSNLVDYLLVAGAHAQSVPELSNVHGSRERVMKDFAPITQKELIENRIRLHKIEPDNYANNPIINAITDNPKKVVTAIQQNSRNATDLEQALLFYVFTLKHFKKAQKEVIKAFKKAGANTQTMALRVGETDMKQKYKTKLFNALVLR